MLRHWISASAGDGDSRHRAKTTAAAERRLVEHPEPVLSARFRLIHGLVRLAQRLVGVCGHLLRERRRYRDLPRPDLDVADVDGLAGGLDQSLEGTYRRSGIRESVSTAANSSPPMRAGCRMRAGTPEPCGKLNQQLVAHIVAVVVVLALNIPSGNGGDPLIVPSRQRHCLLQTIGQGRRFGNCVSGSPSEPCAAALFRC